MSDKSTSRLRLLFGTLNPLGMPLRQKIGLLGLAFLIAIPLLVSLPVVGQFVVLIMPASSWELGLYNVAAALFFAMFAMSWDAVSGYTGEISFGHGLFFAVGGYTSAMLNMGHGLSPWVSILGGVLLAAVAGVLIGVPALRIEGPYLSLVTLVAPLILLQLFIYMSDIFGGEQGLGNPDNLVGLGFVSNYFLALGLFLAVFVLLWALTRSNTGAILTAIREDEDAVSAAGLSTAKFKIFAFVLSGAIGGLAGAAYVHTPVGSPTPSELMSVIINVEVIIAAVLGGMGTIVGAALGGLFVAMVPDYLNLIEFTVPVIGKSISEMSFFLFAIVTLVLLNIFPGGVLRWGIALGRRATGRTGGEEGMAADGGQSPDEGGTDPVEQTIERYQEYYDNMFGGDDE
ncbi:branched-chain amino acid ABC transporter permease [Halorientalis sp. IM1011]|uniref:branched-chain amino acid ABC transporter permease n=1 Tax=Halorientalis sp. IM1011 TaxID=1932360 RepID=UPI000A01F956|nr:branched-chain amino acid ABC transporter permease [Halorientalis sp. IM1011]